MPKRRCKHARERTKEDHDFARDDALFAEYERRFYPRRLTHEESVEPDPSSTVADDIRAVADLILPEPPSHLVLAPCDPVPPLTTVPKPTAEILQYWQVYIDVARELEEEMWALVGPSDPSVPLTPEYFVDSSRAMGVNTQKRGEVISRQRMYIDVVRRVYDTTELPGAAEFKFKN